MGTMARRVGLVNGVAPAGWYADPENPGIARFWDGEAWTDARQAIPARPVVMEGIQGFAVAAVVIVAVVIVLALAYNFA